MDLNTAFVDPLENSMARALLGSVLGTHWLSGLDCTMWTTSVLRHVDNLTSLTATLSHDLSAGAVTTFRDYGGTHSDFGSSSDNRSWGKSLSLALSGRINLSLLDDGRLVAGAHIDFMLGADTAAWVWAQVFDLADMPTGLAFHVIQDYSWDFIELFGRSLGHLRFHKWMFLDEKRAACLTTDDLLQLAVATLSLRNFLLHSSSTSSLASDTLGNIIAVLTYYIIIDADFMDLLNIGADCIILLGALRASFLEAACITGGPLSIMCLLAGHWVSCGLALWGAYLWVLTWAPWCHLGFRRLSFGQNFVNSLLLLDLIDLILLLEGVCYALHAEIVIWSLRISCNWHFVGAGKAFGDIWLSCVPWWVAAIDRPLILIDLLFRAWEIQLSC
mgnify:CR=1 FL=1